MKITQSSRDENSTNKTDYRLTCRSLPDSATLPVSSSPRPKPPRRPKKKHTPPPGDAYITIDDDLACSAMAAVPLLTPQRTPGHLDDVTQQACMRDLAVYFLWMCVRTSWRCYRDQVILEIEGSVSSMDDEQYFLRSCIVVVG